ncbi:hypothetical protein [Nocardia farcinica]|uniref:Uncharacterized protein n=1 Tax=Nocardia farcinica (strain IFM 10152) TaxID=247156 RepID=Q5YZQ4_NOCFA|nr:hypothetical protein [Nocardia farcinica]BAD56337.1 hypothetical protein NFA_14920 [Nocardia farcinica IFM 10152]
MNARRNPVPPESIRDAAALMLAIVTSDHNGVDAILDHCDTDGYFAILPEWVIGADISDRAFRLYAAMQIDQSHGRRSTKADLAARLHISIDRLDEALRELATVGGVA